MGVVDDGDRHTPLDTKRQNRCSRIGYNINMNRERFVVRAPAEKSAAANGTEGAENISGAVHFESLTDLKRNLIPWMQSQRLGKVSIYAYQGQTDREVGHFIATVVPGHSELVDRHGNQVSLFGVPRSSVNRPRARGRLMRIEQWLKEKGVYAQSATFDVFTFEEGDEEQTEQEVEAEALVAAGEPLQVAEPTVQAPVAEVIEPVHAVKIKGPRKPKRKKPIKAERKARLAENAREKYANMLQVTLDRAHQIVASDTSTIAGAHETLSKLAKLVLGADASLIGRFRHDLKHDPKLIEVRVLLSEYENERLRNPDEPLLREDKFVRRLAREMFSESTHTDPFRSHSAMHWPSYETSRTLEEYMSLFALDLRSPEGLLKYLHACPEQRWLDIGSGETYREPMSLMNAMRDINPKVKVVGLDPMYDEQLVSHGDRARGRHRLDPKWAAKNELVAGTAQNMSLPDASFDHVVSMFAFDKFNEATGGTQQALRQVARILKPGGIVRIHGLDLSALERGSALFEYFTPIAPAVIASKTMTDVGKSFATIVFKRVAVSAEEEKKLREDINEWLEKYAMNIPMGK